MAYAQSLHYIAYNPYIPSPTKYTPHHIQPLHPIAHQTYTTSHTTFTSHLTPNLHYITYQIYKADDRMVHVVVKSIDQIYLTSAYHIAPHFLTSPTRYCVPRKKRCIFILKSSSTPSKLILALCQSFARSGFAAFFSLKELAFSKSVSFHH